MNNYVDYFESKNRKEIKKLSLMNNFTDELI